jgi:hypothetical protein
MRASIASRSCTNVRNPPNFFGRSPYQTFDSRVMARLSSPVPPRETGAVNAKTLLAAVNVRSSRPSAFG